ncbi:ABC transporter ATP-binding protein [Pararobbsia alpina]|uniref:Galactose/methyl galactoside import ATP-binding protein MglA n=1 Tax=Pararobbsia alpina TaxID=621374 RepID=A0A6S7BHB8_9BURK|nr:ABC transporter ATP-binding protein [Pararobbsia alpina]CAB3791159.1 Galactose/methyl galactoside import ATP-binding protein MglA [Pararobbsia alpina]
MVLATSPEASAGEAGGSPSKVRTMLEMRRITKRFGATLANDAIDFSVMQGEIHALLGENGAGKSTLMQILYGMVQPDSGEILVANREVRIESPRDAIAAQVGMIHQEFMLVPSLSVVENVVLGLGHTGERLDLAAAARRIAEISEEHGLSVNPWDKVEDLPIGVQQRVEILKLLYRDARLLILDEPTAVLTPQEVTGFFNVLRSLVQQQRAVVIVTHKLREIMSIAQRVTVLRHGRLSGVVHTAQTDEHGLARLMVGRDVNLHVDKPALAAGKTALDIEQLHVRDHLGQPKVRGIDLSVRAGEILGIAGVDGNGQSELAEAILNLRKIESGHVRVAGEDVTHETVARHHAAGLAYVPADRRSVGALTSLSIADNAMLGRHRHFSKRGLRDLRAIREHAAALMKRFDVRASGMDVPAGKLSGGNLQKVIFGREAMRAPKVLVVEQPTRGLDVGAIEVVWQALIAQRAAGTAIVLISAELEEILNLSDRVAVIHGGRIMGIVDAANADATEIGLMMAGATARTDNTAHNEVQA